MSITIRRDGGKYGGGKARRTGWWLVFALGLVIAALGGIVVLAWIKGGPVQMREQAVELSTRQVGVNGQVK